MSKRTLASLLPIIFCVIFITPVLGVILIEGGKLISLRPVSVPVVGTGSMYPSLFWSESEGGPENEDKKLIEEYRSSPHLYRYFRGLDLFGQKILQKEIKRGDMVAFKSQATSDILAAEDRDSRSGFIKRVIGVPGDKIELRDGFVYRNGELIEEPYIASPRSTYAGETMEECTEITVEPDSYFVLGDNRKVSSDSRSKLGQVRDQDIEFYLPYDAQNLYRSLWRNTENDADLLGRPTLNPKEFVDLLNNERRKHSLRPLSLNSQLTRSSTLRGQALLKNKNTNLGFVEAMNQAGYTNIVRGEFASYGRFSAEELLASLLFSPSTAGQIMNGDYTDLGISAVNMEVDGCPTQVIVGHLGGFIPAEYDQESLDSWSNLKSNLTTILPSWEKAMEYEYIDKEKLGELLTILYRRLSLAEEILNTMEKNQWLTDDQKARIIKDNDDAKSAESIITELNER